MTIHIIATGFATPTELVAYLFDCGHELSEQKLARDTDGTWRGEVVMKVKPARARAA